MKVKASLATLELERAEGGGWSRAFAPERDQACAAFSPSKK